MCGGHGARQPYALRARAIPLFILVLSLALGVGDAARAGEATEDQDEAQGEAKDEPAEGEAEDEPAEDEAEDEPAEGVAEADEGAPTSSAPTTRVVVTDTRGATQRTHDAVGATTVIDLNDPAIPASATVADVLAGIAGLSLRRFGGPGDPAFVRIRGSTARQVEIFIDGVPLDGSDAAVDLSELSLDGFDRIEIHRGQAPPELGASAIGGAIHLRSRADVAPSPRAKLGFGSFLTRRASSELGFAGAVPGGLGSLRLSGSYEGSRGDFAALSTNGTVYDDTDDAVLPRANNHHDQIEGGLRARVELGPLRLFVHDRLFWRSEGVPGPQYAAASVADHAVLDELIAGSIEGRASGAVTLLADGSLRVRHDRTRDLRGEIGVGTQDRSDLATRASFGGGLRLEPLPWLALLPSVRVALDAFTPTSLLPGEGKDGTRRRAGLTATVAASLTPWEGRLELAPAVALRVVDQRFLGSIPFQDTPVASGGREVLVEALPRLHVALRPVPALTVRAGVARGLREPSFLELFGDRGGVAGNGTLRPETAWSVDGGARAMGAAAGPVALRGSVEVGGFYRDTRDAIVVVPTAQSVAVAVNLGRTRVGGLEAAGALDLAEILSLSGSLTLTEARIVDGERGTIGKRVPGVPQVQAQIVAGARFREVVRGAWRFDLLSGTYDSPSNFTLQPPRPLHGVSVAVQPGPRWPTLAVDVTNLFDRISAPVARDPLHPAAGDTVVAPVTDLRGQPLPGRAVMVTLELPRQWLEGP